jgi:serine/threonine-protein kinase
MRASEGSEDPIGISPPMTPDRWRVIDTILQAALACSAKDRAAFITDACGDDEALRQEIQSLLAAHERVHNEFLERPAIEVLATPPGRNTEQFTAALADALAGRYAIEREIARGGMATVYLARDLRHDRRVAVKVMRDEVAAAVGAERFLEEIRVTALLQHPHILPLFDSGSQGALLWYVMPFVEGETLRARLTREGRLPLDESVRIACEVAEALEHAHAHGIVHRDVKPENVLLQDGHAIVADFGIALALENAGGERLTRTGLTLGTPHYMSPEQAAGERALDARVDIYALGAVLHEMLAGEAPFAASSRQVVLQRLLLEPPPTVLARRTDVPPSLDAAIRRALAKRPNERFPSAASFGSALTGALQRPPYESTASGEVQSGESAPSSRRMVTARFATYAALGGIGAGLLGGWGLAHTSAVNRWRDGAIDQEAASPSLTTADAVATVGNTDGLSLVVVDRRGQLQRTIPANRPWTPRFSPDGKRVAYGAFGPGRQTSDVWITDVDGGATRRLTDDDGDSNDPQWSPDGSTVAYSVNAPGGKDIASRRLSGGGAKIVAARDGTQFPSDWLRDGSALLVTDDAGANGHDILVQPTDGSAAQQYEASSADETTARISPDGRWIAYTSTRAGRSEVYLDSYPRAGKPLLVSRNTGFDPTWRADGRELYYWRDDALIAVSLDRWSSGSTPAVGAETVLFHAPYNRNVNTMYDVSPDGSRFVLVQHQ